MQDSENTKLMISVIICTYNRVELFANALQTIREQTLETSYYEIIVVDNNSQDGTHDIMEHFCRDYANIRYCFET
jgi:glycosyltransferase involved in cell wall biosynthesis